MGLPASVFTPTRVSMTLHIPAGPTVPVTVETLVTTKDPFNQAGELYYLQVVRQFPWLLESELMAARCQAYLDHVSAFAVQLVSAAGVDDCDAMVGVPTNRGELLRPYLEAARTVHAGIVDVTPLVHRDPDAGSTSEFSFAERQARHEVTGTLPPMHRLLIIDDFLATGESAAQVIELVRRHTNPTPEFVIAAPLWVPHKDPSASFLR
jgi:hypothetical protein